MHRDQRTQLARPRKRRAGVRKRTDGSPRLIAPGEAGNPYPEHWAIAWTDKSGAKQRSRVITTRETEEARARDALIVFKTEHARPPAERDITVRKVCDAYIAAKESEVASHRSLKSALQPIIEAFGPLNPADIAQANITNYVAERSKAPRKRGGRGGVVKIVDGTVSRKTIKNELLMFKVACNWALGEGWAITIPPIKKQKKATRARKRTLSRKEFGRLLVALTAPATPQHLRTFTVIAMLTGQRSGAIRALKWEHIDFDDGKIWFTRANPDAPDNKRVLDHPMTDALAAALREALQAAQEERREAALKPRRKGKAAPPLGYVVEFRFARVGSLKTAWKALLARAEIDDVWIHDLRRSFTSAAADEGAELQEIADFMGVDVKTLRRHYAFSAPERHRALLEKIDGGPA